MKIRYFGHSCFALQFANGTTIITDPFDETTGYPLCTASCTAAALSHDHFDHNHVQSLTGDFITLDKAGTYEIGGVRIEAIESFHDDKEGSLRGKNLLFKFEGDGFKIAHLGDLGHMPNEEQIAFLKNMDIVMLPVGGYFTIDTKQAEEILAEIQPHTALAMHFKAAANDFPISDEKQFAADLHAEYKPGEIDFDCVCELPAVMVMDWQ